MAFIPSTYQQAIFDHVQQATGPRIMGAKASTQNVVVDAVAGSGKSTTIKQAVNQYVPQDARVVVVAFNTAIARALEPQLIGRTVKTYHALGLSGIRSGNKRLRIVEQGDDKVKMILRQFLDRSNWGGVFPVITRMVSLCKNLLMDDLSDGALDALAADYNLDLGEDWEVIFDAVRRVMRESAEITDYIDFDDMIWFPYRHQDWVRIPQFDVGLIDELQDTNAAQGWLIRRALGNGGFVMGVGDPYQSIYAFRGADTSAMPTFIRDFKATVLPLSISYRCPRAVVALVNGKFSEIAFEAGPDAIDGAVCDIPADRLDLQPSDMVLCRMNAPLVPMAFSLIRKGINVTIRGRDIGTNLKSLIRRMKADDLGDLMSKLRVYCDNEVYKLTRAEKEVAAQSVTDKVETIIHVATNCHTVQDVENRITQIFSDGTSPIVLSSVHKAKGLEADNVYLAEPHLLGPSRRCKTPSDIQQERNVEYVAITRAKKTLNYVRPAVSQ